MGKEKKNKTSAIPDAEAGSPAKVQKANKRKQKAARESANEPTQSMALSASKQKSLAADIVEIKNKGKENIVDNSIKDNMMVQQNRFPWVSFKRNLGDNYVWCTVCEMSLYMPNSMSGLEHQRSSHHIRLRNERTRNIGDKREDVSAAVAAAIASGSSAVIQKVAMDELQSKYSWLEPDANDESLCYCRVCDLQLVIKALYLRQHDISKKHVALIQKSNSANKPVPTEDGELQETDNDRDSEQEEISDDNLADPPAKRSRQMDQMDVHPDRGALNDDKDQEEAMGQGNGTAQAPEPVNAHLTNVQPSEPRHVIDLFCDSINQTMKSLPADLAAEGKAEIMKVVSNLEIKALNRKIANEAPPTSSPKPSSGLDAADQLRKNNNNGEVSTLNKSTPNSSLCKSSKLQVRSRVDTDFMGYGPMDKLMAHIVATGNGGHDESAPDKSAIGKKVIRNNASQLQVAKRKEPDSMRHVPMHMLLAQSNATENGPDHDDGTEVWQYAGFSPTTRERQEEGDFGYM